VLEAAQARAGSPGELAAPFLQETKPCAVKRTLQAHLMPPDRECAAGDLGDQGVPVPPTNQNLQNHGGEGA